MSSEGKENLDFAFSLFEKFGREPYIGEAIPQAWLAFDSRILEARNNTSLLKMQEVMDMAQECGVYGDEVCTQLSGKMMF